MTPLSFSSGNLLADRRADYAMMLRGAGDLAAAARLMGDALALAPAWTAGHFRHGEMLAEAGETAAAIEAWTTVLRLDPDDRHGAAVKLALYGALAAMDSLPPAFVETLFDQYADRFDQALVDRLAYRVPELLADAIARQGRAGFAHAVDLGCGTGLMGERLRLSVSFLEGIDISSNMLRRAAAKGIYDRLAQSDLMQLDALPHKADLVTAADVFTYVGVLDRVLALAAAALAPGTLLAFSVERHDGPEAMVLHPSRRYAHSEPHLRASLLAAGFDVASLDRAIIRTDRAAPVDGLIVVAERAGRRQAAGRPGRTGRASSRRPAH